MAVKIRVVVFSVVKPCSDVGYYQPIRSRYVYKMGTTEKSSNLQMKVLQ
jgi:hypothetical protein